MRYRLIIFDFDGTLADSFPHFVGHMRQVVEHFRLRSVDENDLEALRGCGAREVIAYLRMPYWKVPVVASYMRRLMEGDVARTHLFPGVAELLRRLKQSGLTLAIVSSNSEANIRAILGPENAASIGVFECGASLFGKAAKFRKVLKQTRVRASETLAIGDEIRDLEAARKAQIDFGAVSWGYTKVAALQACSPAFIFTQSGEIEGAVNP